MWGGVTVVKTCDSLKGGVKVLLKRCVSLERVAKVMGRCDSCQERCQDWGSVTGIRKMC